MTNTEIALALREAFNDGYEGYTSPCCCYVGLEAAWRQSGTKALYDSLLKSETKDHKP